MKLNQAFFAWGGFFCFQFSILLSIELFLAHGLVGMVMIVI